MIHTCVVCHSAFQSRREAKYCSGNCSSKYQSMKQHQSKPSIKCLECGIQFTRLYGNKTRTCSDECRTEHKRKDKRIYKYKRRAKLKGLKTEVVNPELIFSRDSWKCQACGCDTPKELRGTLNDNAPELDHVTPLALGGEHTELNTQCLCRVCNILKGDKSNDEFLQLFFDKAS